MGSFSIWHWLVVGILVMLLFGRGRFSEMMGDVAKGIKSFKKGMAEDEHDSVAGGPPRPPSRIATGPAYRLAALHANRDEQPIR